ncbi:MAG: IS630 family transposase, partial [Acaryochloris sp. CRU_2_0]|nr:IS630 family transposase [Acaryochloris sp. CRU_2_0]
GLEGLLEVKTPPGQAPRIGGTVLEQLKERLSQRQGFSSYGAIEEWLSQAFGVNVAYSTVHRTVRYQLKAKLKVPRPRSKDADEPQQQAFKKTAAVDGDNDKPL